MRLRFGPIAISRDLSANSVSVHGPARRRAAISCVFDCAASLFGRMCSTSGRVAMNESDVRTSVEGGGGRINHLPNNTTHTSTNAIDNKCRLCSLDIKACPMNIFETFGLQDHIRRYLQITVKSKFSLLSLLLSFCGSPLLWKCTSFSHSKQCEWEGMRAIYSPSQIHPWPHFMSIGDKHPPWSWAEFDNYIILG